MDLEWVAAFFKNYEWLIMYLEGMVKPAAALAVVLLAVALSYSQKLSLESDMIYSVTRSFLQLSVIGFVLQFIFNQENAGWIVLAYLFMVSVAGYTAGQRAKHVPRGKYVAGVSILAGTSITMFLLVALNVFPFTPRYMIPVTGMMVGNAMTVTGVTMKQLRDNIKMQQNLVETALALGATPRQATLQQVKRALVISLSPVLDNCKTVGLISLPGAMTGMIMGGASPLEAIQLQIVVMNMMVGTATNINPRGHTRLRRHINPQNTAHTLQQTQLHSARKLPQRRVIKYLNPSDKTLGRILELVLQHPFVRVLN
ncbi:hypothetical protein N665_0081s0036 [Sinapis alba]|nr:hypothetical protein N665_0081s0036 [Sinapis alba]